MLSCPRLGSPVQVWYNARMAPARPLHGRTGTVVWDVAVGDPQAGYSITGAPLAVKGNVIVGVGGGEFGIRGFLDAYDATTGKRAWRFYTVPAPGERGHETWSGASWKTGGAPTWLTGSFDPESNVVYWGVGNPSPPYQGDERAGDNLYSNSVVAVDADTGTLKWHFQFTPHDEHDWDAAPAHGVAEPERLLLRARPRDRAVLVGPRIRHAVVGGRDIARRPASREARQ